MSNRLQGSRQAYQERRLTNYSEDTAWVNEYERTVLNDAVRELYGKPEDLVHQLMRGVKDIKNRNEDEQ